VHPVKAPHDFRAFAQRSVTLIVSLAAAFLTFWAKEHADNQELSASLRHRWFIFALLAITVSVGLPVIRQWRTERAAIRAKVMINDALGPIAGQFARLAALADPSERAQVRDHIIPMILTSVEEVVAIGKTAYRVRVCWYPYDEGVDRLIPGTYVGRSTAPTTVFSNDNDEGKTVLALLKNNKPYINRNVPKSPPIGWYAVNHGDYRSLIAVPVIAGNIGFGILFVDALRIGALNEADLDVVKLFADHLASAVALGSKGWPNGG
jgi:GAF domain-containing protein